jgi:MinD superfamily P-loop ATPase
MIVAVASGKGGTGKTTVATSLALSLAEQMPVCLLDCDVEAPNAHLFLHPRLDRQTEAQLPVPQVDPSRCQQCGTCAQVCQYHAVAVLGQTVLVFPELCHGCGSCTLNCPESAISEVPRSLGVLESGRAASGIRFARGTLNIGEPLAVPVIRQLKQWCDLHSDELVIIDAPPGTSCPVVEAIRGADYILLVTEPTPFGLHDLRLAYDLTHELGIPAGVILNRDGVGTADVEQFCVSTGLPVLLRIPLDRAIAEGLAQGIPLVNTHPEYQARFQEVFERVCSELKERVC